MSVQCPHCGGEFQVELTLSVPAPVATCAPRAVLPPSPAPDEEPNFRVNSAAGKFRRALWRAGYHDAAVSGRIYNDKLTGGRSRMKLVWYVTVDAGRLDPFLREQFGSDLDAHRNYGQGEYVVYFWRSID